MDKTQKTLHSFFELSIILKGISALIETLGGILVLFISRNAITKVVMLYSQNELSENPNDLFFKFLSQTAHSFSIGGQVFAALYLLSHGIVKLVLVYALLKEKLWAYPASLAVLGLFILYQTYQYILNHSVLLILLTIYDIIIMALIYNEYRMMKKGYLKSKSVNLR